jgi:uncharacterized protein YbjT (DUF2867 family)
MRVFVAGASGVIGVPLVRDLVAAGHRVTGTTSKPENAARIEAAGAEPVVCDALDPQAVHAAVRDAAPEVVISQLTRLPREYNPRKIDYEPTNRARAEGGHNMIEAARAVGAKPRRILFHHILPNCVSPLVVKASMDMGTAILAAAGLGFIGLGAQPPYPEWGAMISVGRNYLPTWWWYSTFPGLFIYMTVLGFNLLGDGLRDVLDPKSRG